MKKKLLIALLSASMMFSASVAIAGCDDGKKPDNPDGPGIEQPEHTEPKITVDPAEVEIYEGDEIDLLFGVSATDDGGNAVNVIVFDDNGFDKDTEGVYTITYKATDSNNLSSTATRKVTVLKELAPITMEARTDKFNKPVWESKEKINFKHREYHELTESKSYTEPQSGVFHNTSENEITVTVEGTHGVSAILDKHGMVVEGRDGANGRLVNEANPSRATSSVTTIKIGEEEVEVLSAFAKEMKIPAGGFAIVVQNGYAGTTADTDGRGYMNYNVIGEYGNVVRLFWTDAEEGEYLTEYANQKPTVSGNTDILAFEGDTQFNLETAIKEGITAKDDNGTFDAADDVTLTEITLEDDGGFDINVAGEYEITLSVTDGVLKTTFARKVKVVAKENAIELTFGNNVIRFLTTGLAKDEELTSVGNYNLIVYTYAYKSAHEELGFATGYGAAYVINRYGKIVRTYDGANGRYNDATHDDVVDAELCAAGTYAAQAYASLQEGETVFIAPHNTLNGNSSAGGTRNTFMQAANRKAIGAAFNCTGFEWEEKPYVFTVGEGAEAPVWSALESKYAFNQDGANAASLKMLVYTKAYTGEVKVNGFGNAIILDRYGKIVRIYSGSAKAGVYDANGKTFPAGYGGGVYAQEAFKSLANGETLVIFPHSGTAENNPRAFVDELIGSDNAASVIGLQVSLTDMIFADPSEPVEESVEFAVGEKKFEIVESKYAHNTAVTTPANYGMIVFTKAFEGELDLSGYKFGAAIVLDRYGKLIKIYDGANVGVWDETGKLDPKPEGFGADNYATYAWTNLAEGEMLIIFPNGGPNDARGFALGLRQDGSIGKTATLTGVEFEIKGTTITIGDKKFLAPEAAYSYNKAVATPANYKMIAFTKAFEGELDLSGYKYGAAIVLDRYGKLIKVYDGANVGVYDETGKIATPAGYGAANYATYAWANLAEGETLIIFPNDGGTNAARAFALGLRTDGSIGKTVTLTGVTFEEAQV